ncbi:MAG: hypothetical protein FWD40_01240 [Treponema sp.]|nr:hypothetical protein [Treponema sp.]
MKRFIFTVMLIFLTVFGLTFTSCDNNILVNPLSNTKWEVDGVLPPIFVSPLNINYSSSTYEITLLGSVFDEGSYTVIGSTVLMISNDVGPINGTVSGNSLTLTHIILGGEVKFRKR